MQPVSFSFQNFNKVALKYIKNLHYIVSASYGVSSTELGKDQKIKDDPLILFGR